MAKARPGVRGDLFRPVHAAAHRALCGGREPRALDRAQYARRHAIPTSNTSTITASREFGTIKASDGQALNYEIMTPPGFDPAKKYPVVVEVYGGPNVGQSVVQPLGRPRGPADGRRGLCAVQARQPRHAQPLGRPSRRRSTTTSAGSRSRTSSPAWRYLKTLPYVDPDRIAIAGWSYGGFMTLSLLTAKDSPFAVGLAGAPPTKWSLYDTHYTEQFMGTPRRTRTATPRATWCPSSRR